MSLFKISLVMGIAVLCIMIFAVARYPREQKVAPVARWLDTHPLREWMRHRS